MKTTGYGKAGGWYAEHVMPRKGIQSMVWQG